MLRWIFLTLMGFCLLFSVSNAVSSVYAASETRKVRIGVYDNNPKVYRDSKGHIAGLFPDILNYIAKQENWKIVYVYGSWDEGLNRLEKGDIDLMVDVAVSKERQKKYDFTKQTVFSSWGVIYVNKNSTIKSWRDLDGKKIAILKSSVYYGGTEGVDAYIRAFGYKAKFVKVDEYDDVFNLLNKGEVDAAVVSRIFGLINEKKYSNIKETDIFFTPTELHFALTKNDTDNQYLIGRLDYWVNKLKSGHKGIYHQILKRYGLEGMIPTREVTPKWVVPVGFTMVVILVLLSVIILRLIKKIANSIQKLRESEERFRSTLDNMIEGGQIISFDWRYLYVNDSAVKHSRKTREELLGKTMMEIYSGIEKTPEFTVLKKCMKKRVNQEINFEFSYADGIKNWFHLYIQPVPEGIFIMTQDITAERQKAEEIKARNKELVRLTKSQIENSNAMMKVLEDLKEAKSTIEAEKAKDDAMLESIGEGLIAVDNDGKVVIMNKSAEKILGWQLKEIKGTKLTDLSLEDEDGNSLPVEKRPSIIALSTGKMKSDNYFFIRKNKTRIPIVITATPIKLSGKTIGLVEIFRDVTREKEINSQRDAFIGIASHELKTPVTSIKAYTQILLARFVKTGDEQTAALLMKMDMQLNKLTGLIVDLLDITKIKGGKLQLHNEYFYFDDLVDEIVGQLQFTTQKHKIIKEGKAKKTIYGDRERIGQVLINLLENAIKYSPHSDKIIVNTLSSDKEVEIRVTDFGVGIAKEKQPHIFKRYYRETNAEEITFPGLGLGLFVSAEIVKRHKGKIWLKSEKGKGSIFYFTIPVDIEKKFAASKV